MRTIVKIGISLTMLLVSGTVLFFLPICGCAEEDEEPEPVACLIDADYKSCLAPCAGVSGVHGFRLELGFDHYDGKITCLNGKMRGPFTSVQAATGRRIVASHSAKAFIVKFLTKDGQVFYAEKHTGKGSTRFGHFPFAAKSNLAIVESKRFLVFKSERLVNIWTDKPFTGHIQREGKSFVYDDGKLVE